MSMHITKEFTFHAAHTLTINHIKESIHGHSWKVAITLAGKLDSDGMVFDFRVFETEVTEAVISKLDHTYLNDLIAQPSAEHLAMWIWKALNKLPLFAVQVWESKDASATYYGDE